MITTPSPRHHHAITTPHTHATTTTTTRIASASECRPQLEAYHQRAATILKDLIQRLRDQRRPIESLSEDDKADISDLMHELQRFAQEVDGIS